MKTLFLDALHSRNSSRPPVWLMRQAGRYLPEYRKIREKHAFLQMCHRPEIAAEVTLLPIKIFEMDAAILFSDILVIPEALGVGLRFDEGKGPIIERPLNLADDVNSLPKIDVNESLEFVSKAIKYVLPQLDVPLIGFCGAPFTVASYMIEGGSSPDLKKTKKWMLRDPESFHDLLSRITECTIDYLNLQIESGIHAIQIFDSWANALGHSQFRESSLRYLKKIIESLKNPQIPVIIFCRGSSVFLQDLLEAKPQGISLDWNIDISRARAYVPQNIALQGNLDPDILYAPLQRVKSETERMLHSMKKDKGYIFNLGHGVKPDIPVEAVKTLVDTIKSFS
jgi:uroporphyrinogen decarboxylase